VVGAFAITRALAMLPVDPACTPMPLSCGAPIGYRSHPTSRPIQNPSRLLSNHTAQLGGYSLLTASTCPAIWSGSQIPAAPARPGPANSAVPRRAAPQVPELEHDRAGRRRGCGERPRLRRRRRRPRARLRARLGPPLPFRVTLLPLRVTPLPLRVTPPPPSA
jgi:hypothetical protein